MFQRGEGEEEHQLFAVSVSTLLCSNDLEEPFVPPVPAWFPWEPERQRHHSAEVKCPQDAMIPGGETIREE